MSRGRPRRKAREFFTYGDLSNAKKILRLNPTEAPRCICGDRDYFYFIHNGNLLARCRNTHCKFERTFDQYACEWGPSNDIPLTHAEHVSKPRDSNVS